MMAQTISLFRCLCKVDRDACKIIQLMNAEICDTTSRGMFVTFVAGWLTPQDKVLKIINAGHLPPILLQAKSARQIEAQGPPLGVVGGTDYRVEEMPFADAALCLYTDGITESLTEGGEELGIKGLLRWLLESRNLAVNEQLAYVEERLRRQAVRQTDDQTMMILCG